MKTEMSHLDNAIVEAKKRSPSAENLNYLGDLYLRKAQKFQALKCFYESIEKMHYGQKEKQIAIYKKILRHSPKDIKAYEGIINIYARMGLANEEIEYLIVLTNLYENLGNYNKVNAAIKRIKYLDPDNEIAQEYMKKWEDFYANEVRRSPENFANSDEVERIDESGNDAYVKEEPEHKDSKPDMERTPDLEEQESFQEKSDENIVFKVKDQADTGFFSVSLEESVSEPRPSSSRARRKEVKFIFALGILGIVIAIAFILLTHIDRDSRKAVPVKSIQGDEIVVQWKNRTLSFEADNYEFNIRKMTDREIIESNITAIVNQSQLSDHTVYTVSVKPLDGCLPDEFVSYPYKMVSLIDKTGSSAIQENTEKLQGLSKIIYKSQVCNKEFGAVYIKFYLYHNRDIYYTGSIFKGLKETPLIVRWKL